MHLRIILYHFLGITLLLNGFSSCANSKHLLTTNYEYLEYKQQGNLQMDMRMYPGSNRGKIKIMLSSMNYQSYTKSFELNVDGNLADAFDDFYNALNGTLPAEQKDSKQKTSNTLTINLIQGSKSIEVTNPILLERFKVFEDIIRNQIHP